MKRILRIGMDVYSTNHTLCAIEPIIGEADSVFSNIQVTPDYKNILNLQVKSYSCEYLENRRGKNLNGLDNASIYPSFI